MEKNQRNIEPVDISWYKKLSSDEKQRIISSSKQEEIYRAPKPIDNLNFQQENFIELIRTQVQTSFWNTTTKSIKLATYREKSCLNIIKGIVCLFHGLTSHTNEGIYVAKQMSKAGYEVVGFDQRGFGKSEGKRGYISDVNTSIEDTIDFINKVKLLYPQTPLIICGLSMGGLICFNLGLRYPDLFSGVILMAPALKSHYGFSARFAAKFLSFFNPNLQIPKKTGGRQSKHGSKNPNVSESRKGDVNRYRQDPYINTLKCVLDGMSQSQDQFHNLNCKRLLIIQGAVDNSVDPQGAIQLYQKAKCQDKQILFYSNLWHNIWQQEQIYDIMPRVLRWLDKCLVKIESQSDSK